jgi:hypothetical protein
MTTAGHRTILRFRVRVDRLVVMTLTLMFALITYDGWERLSFLDVATIIIGDRGDLRCAPVRWRDRRASPTRPEPDRAQTDTLIARDAASGWVLRVTHGLGLGALSLV